MTPEERFVRKVDTTPGFGPHKDCHRWLGATGGGGRGVMRFEGRLQLAHCVAYQLKHGQIPNGLMLDHFYCDNGFCVNADHVRPVTAQENTLRGDTIAAAKAAQTHCIHGHELAGANLYIHPQRGTRHCKQCDRDRLNRRYARSKGGQVRRTRRPKSDPCAN